MLSIKETIIQTAARMRTMTPEELRAEFDITADGEVASALAQCQVALHRARTEKERKPQFQSGDAVVFCDDIFIVLKNEGIHGRVSDVSGRTLLTRHYWSFEGELTRYATREELQPFHARGLPLAIIAMGQLLHREEVCVTS